MARPMALVLTPSAGLSVSTLNLSDAWIGVPDPKAAERQHRLGVSPARLLGITGGGLEESDYKEQVPGMKDFAPVDATRPGWQQRLVDFVSRQNPGRRIVVISSPEGLLAGLEELGVSSMEISRALEVQTKSAAALAEMD